MIRNAQARPKWLATIFIGSAAILLFAPSAAWAGSSHRDYDRHRTHGQHQSQFAYRHHDSHERDRHVSNERDRHVSHKRNHHGAYRRDHHVSHKRNHHGVYRRDHHVSHKRHHQRGYEKHHIGYYCKPCNHYFSARDELYDHVAYQHRVPYRHLSLALSFGTFGWIFFG